MPEARVLVVDDEDSITDLVATALRYVGFEVAVASNGRQALERAATFRPELVVLDVMLPDLDGFEVVRRLGSRSCSSPPGTPPRTRWPGSRSAVTTTSRSRSRSRS
jgi:two-component system OmpR family response regulator